MVAGLLVTQSYFGFMTPLGIVATDWILINNAIALIDKIRIETEGGTMPSGVMKPK